MLDLLVPAAPGRLEAYPVSTMVNAVKNNGPELPIEPLEPLMTGPARASTHRTARPGSTYAARGRRS